MIINNGPIGGVNKINPLVDLQYSYDNITWQNFTIDNEDNNKLIDLYECAELDLHTGILKIKASGYLINNNHICHYYQDDFANKDKQVKLTVHNWTWTSQKLSYGSDWEGEDSYNEVEFNETRLYQTPKFKDTSISKWLGNNDKSFYIKTNKNSGIFFCLVGGGGGGSSCSSEKIGGGGAGGEVVYNNKMYKIHKNHIYKIQIGIGGYGGGGKYNAGSGAPLYSGRTTLFPRDGGKTIFSDLDVNKTIEANGGKGAHVTGFYDGYKSVNGSPQPYQYSYGSGLGGDSYINDNNDNYIHNSAKGGDYASSKTAPEFKGTDGTCWPQDNKYYGGGGSGSLSSNNVGTITDTENFGGLGGGGSQHKDGAGSPGEDNTGGGASGTCQGNYCSSWGGTGVCLIQFQLK